MEKKKNQYEAIGGPNSPNEFLGRIKNKRLTATEVMIKERDLKNWSEKAMLDLFKGGLVFSQQLERIERMLKWVIVRKKLDYLSHDLEHNEYKKEFRKPILDDMFKLGEQLPDISDIIKP